MFSVTAVGTSSFNKALIFAIVSPTDSTFVLLFDEVDGVEFEVLVLGFDDVAGYEINPSYFGSVIAPSANRIEGASFELNGATYSLKKNKADI